MRSNEGLSRRQRILAVVAGVIFIAAVGLGVYLTYGKSAARLAAERVFICAETGKIFEHTIREGEEEPIKSPYTGRNTGYEPETCFWTKGPDGKYRAKLTPTYVLLKSRVNPKTREKTYCPDCGREVKPHNPLPPQRLLNEAEQEAKKK